MTDEIRDQENTTGSAEQQNGTDVNGSEQQTTFTQDDVNRIVQKRVAKYSDYEDLKAKAAKYDEAVEASKSDLQKATEKAAALEKELNELKTAEQIRTVRTQVAQSKGIPEALLTGTTEEECTAQAEVILAWAKDNKPGYPKVPDGGDPGSTKPAREVFMEWLNNQ